MKFSIIIPVYNAEKTLKACLDSVFASNYKDFEVIAVDDGSTDGSSNIIRGYPCKLISLGANKKPSFAKNKGKENSNGEILVFMDTDVVVKKDTLDIIGKILDDDKEAVAVTGLLSKDSPHKDFFTQYKNLYMHYIFSKCAGYIEFLYGSIMAIKRDYFLNFDESLRLEDTELGQRYKSLKKKILLNPQLEVMHLKKYNFKKIIKNDFLVPFWWAKSFILHKGYKDIFMKKRFAHARANQLVSIFIAYFVFVCLFFMHYTWAKISFAPLLFMFLLLNRTFFAFLYREKGATFLIKSIFFTFFDLLIMGFGALAGLFYFSAFKGVKNAS